MGFYQWALVVFLMARVYAMPVTNNRDEVTSSVDYAPPPTMPRMVWVGMVRRSLFSSYTKFLFVHYHFEAPTGFDNIILHSLNLHLQYQYFDRGQRLPF